MFSRFRLLEDPAGTMLRLLLAELCLVGLAAGQQSLTEQPITARLIQQGGNDYYSVVSNRSGSEVTAYAIVITMYGGRSVRHYYDVRMLARPVIKPGASVQEFIDGIALKVRLLAAVFADGSTFGDPREVADLMNRRNVKLSALSEIASILCDARPNGLDRQTLIASLENGQSKIDSGSRMAALIVSSTFNEAIAKLKRASPSDPASIEELLQGIKVSGSAMMEDPIKDPNGNPYIDIAPARLSCR